MTSKDKTREKLMGSMRKTKAEAGIGSDEKPEDVRSGQLARSEAEKPMTKKKAAPRASRAQQAAPTATASSDSYQSGRRVWPD